MNDPYTILTDTKIQTFTNPNYIEIITVITFDNNKYSTRKLELI